MAREALARLHVLEAGATSMSAETDQLADEDERFIDGARLTRPRAAEPCRYNLPSDPTVGPGHLVPKCGAVSSALLASWAGRQGMGRPARCGGLPPPGPLDDEGLSALGDEGLDRQPLVVAQHRSRSREKDEVSLGLRSKFSPSAFFDQ